MLPRYVTLALLSSLGAGIACSGEGNTGRTPISDELAAQVPWVNGRLPLIDETGDVVRPTAPAFPSIAQGLPDPGSAPADCSEQAGVAFLPVWTETFEPETPGRVGAGEAWASYDDYTEGSFHSPGDVTWYKDIKDDVEWGLPAEKVVGAPACDGKPNDWVLHYKGGRFDDFGAGLNHPLALLKPGACSEPGLCPPYPADTDTVDAAGFPVQPNAATEAVDPEKHKNARPAYWDLSGYDGIAFWARRGPEGQNAMVVIMHDKHTSDDLNRENNTYCRRIKPCSTACRNNQVCQPEADMEGARYRCMDPDRDLPTGLEPSLLELLYPPCGVADACKPPSTYPDPLFDDKQCRPYTFATHESGEYCFNPEDPPPPDSDERCGDGWAHQVDLTLDWKFYKVPFTELRQQGFGKVAPKMDLKTMSNMAFTFTFGWVDAYIDNVTFYREVD